MNDRSPLLVRLPNHLGDTCMLLPALDALAPRRPLTLLGRRFAPSLFGGYAWPVEVLADDLLARVAQLRRLARRGLRPALLATNSFGSALEARLGGLAPIGYPTEGRGVLLARRIAPPAGWPAALHTVGYYYGLAQALGARDALPPALHLRVAPAARQRAAVLLAAAGVTGAPIVLCPAAINPHRGRDKAWPGFAALAAALVAAGHAVVACGGPGEEAQVARAAPAAIALPATDVGTFAAVLAASRLAVTNDSGAAHLAAAVGVPLVAVFGVTDPARTRPWSPRATVLGSAHGWPADAAVHAAVAAALDGPAPTAVVA